MCLDTPGEVDVAEPEFSLPQTTLTAPRTLNPPKLSAVGRLLHAMSSWCTPSTWELLRRRENKAGVGRKGEEEEGVDGEEVEGMLEYESGRNVKNREGASEVLFEEGRVKEGGYYRIVKEGAGEKRMGGNERNSRTLCSNNDQEVVPKQKRGRSMESVSGTEMVAGSSSGYLPAIHSSSQTQLQIGIFLQQVKRR